MCMNWKAQNTDTKQWRSEQLPKNEAKLSPSPPGGWHHVMLNKTLRDGCVILGSSLTLMCVQVFIQ